MMRDPLRYLILYIKPYILCLACNVCKELQPPSPWYLEMTGDSLVNWTNSERPSSTMEGLFYGFGNPHPVPLLFCHKGIDLAAWRKGTRLKIRGSACCACVYSSENILRTGPLMGINLMKREQWLSSMVATAPHWRLDKIYTTFWGQTEWLIDCDHIQPQKWGWLAVESICIMYITLCVA